MSYNFTNSTPTAVLRSGTETIVVTVVNIAFSLCGTFGNLLVCISVLLNKDLRTVTNGFICSLAVADLLVCMVAQPMYVGTFWGIENYAYEVVRKTFTWMSVMASVSNLWAVTVDRFISISSPLKYPQRLTTRRAALIITFLWIIAVSIGIMSTFRTEAKTIAQFYTMALLLCIFPIYFRVFCIARRHARTIAVQRAHLKRLQLPTFKSKRERDNLAARTIGTVLAVFLVCWLPLITLPFFYRSRFASERRQIVRAFVWVNTLALCSSAVNPIIYSLNMETFRMKMKDTLVGFIMSFRQPRFSDGNSENV